MKCLPWCRYSVLLLVALLIWRCGARDAPKPTLQEIYQQGMAAYQDSNYNDYLKAMKRAHDVRPHHPSVVYNLASAQALTGNHDSALFWLNRFADLGFTGRPEQDSDFVSLREKPLFQAVTERISANGLQQGKPEIAFSLPDSTLLTEGIAADSRSNNFFISSIYQRKIIRMNAEGEMTTFVSSGEHGLGSVFGLTVDTTQNLLWAASTILDLGQQNKNEIGKSGLFAFQLNSGKLVHQILLPADSLEHLFGDLTLTPDGDVYISDGGAGMVYVYKSGATTLEPILPPGTLRSPQGLVCFAEPALLLVADYSTGIYRVDLPAGTLTPMALATPMCLLGIDGLSTDGTALYAIQNGIRPHRVVKLSIDLKRNRVLNCRVLAANHPDFDEPTLGVVVSDWFYFNGTSQWRFLDQAGALVNPEAMQPSKIFRLPL